MFGLPPPSLPVESSGYAWPFGSYNYFNYSSSAPWYLPTLWGWMMPYYMTHVWDAREQFTWGHQQQRMFWPAAAQGPLTPTARCYRAPNFAPPSNGGAPPNGAAGVGGTYDENGNFVAASTQSAPARAMRPMLRQPNYTFGFGPVAMASAAQPRPELERNPDDMWNPISGQRVMARRMAPTRQPGASTQRRFTRGFPRAVPRDLPA